MWATPLTLVGELVSYARHCVEKSIRKSDSSNDAFACRMSDVAAVPRLRKNVDGPPVFVKRQKDAL